ncbi:TPA: hypothetical protein H1012_01010 [archaeon]|nr:hypothetical protein [Candidatus Naiadarchaeales archaeon SRR2090159.bin1288]
MATEAVTLKKIYNAVNALTEKVEEMDAEIHDLREEEVRPEYIEKLKRLQNEPLVEIKDFSKHFGVKK